VTILDRIGIDLGTATAADAPAMARSAADAGARIGRVRFVLGAQSGVDEHVIAEATAVADGLVAAGLRVIGVVDGGLTVAPDGLGDSAPDALAAAWADELSQNAAALAGALGARVGAWEILPAPNAPDGPRMSAARWAAAVDAVCRAVGLVAPDATLVAGGLWNDDADDGVDFLRAAARAAGWSASRQPFDGLAIQLHLFRDGGPSEGTVAATLSERSQRLWRAAAAALGDEAIESLWVTGVAWDAVYAGESAQARNAWTALDTFTANPDVAAVIWTGLIDEAGATGLYASGDLSPDHRRPAWRAFKDFALYAAQISPAPQILIHEPDESFEVTPGSGSGSDAATAAPWPEAGEAAAETAGPATESMGDAKTGEASAWDAAPDEVEVPDVTGDIIDLEATGTGWHDVERAEESAPAEGAAASEVAPVVQDDDAPWTDETIERGVDGVLIDAFELTEDGDANEPLQPAAEDRPQQAIDLEGAATVDVDLDLDVDVDDEGEALDAAEPATEGVAPTMAEGMGEDEVIEAFEAVDRDADDGGDMGDASVVREMGAVIADGDETARAEQPEADAGDERDDDWLGLAAGEVFDIQPTIVGASDRAADAAPPPVEGDAEAVSGRGAEDAEDDGDAPVLWTIPPGSIEPEAADALGDDALGAEAQAAEAASPTMPSMLPEPSMPTEPATAPGPAMELPSRAEVAGSGAAAASAPATVTVRIPTLVDVLRGQGLDGQRLEAALRTLEARAGAPGQLPPPGDYAIALLPAVAPAAAPGVVGGRTNQSVLSALYRAGGGRWTLLERAGLDLTRLVTERTAAYDGPDVADLPGLSDAERQAVRAALG